MTAKTEHQRRVRHITSADIESPGDRGRICKDGIVGGCIGDCCGQIGEFLLCFPAGPLDRMNINAFERWARLVGPDQINRIFVKGHQCATGGFDSCPQCLNFRDCVKPGVETESGSRRKPILGPFCRRIGDQAFNREDCSIDLCGNLFGVASINKNECVVVQHHSGAGRSGESGQPGQSF